MGGDFWRGLGSGLQQFPGRAENVAGLGLDALTTLNAAASHDPTALLRLQLLQSQALDDPAFRAQIGPFQSGLLGYGVHSQPVPGASTVYAPGQAPPPVLRPNLPPLSAGRQQEIEALQAATVAAGLPGAKVIRPLPGGGQVTTGASPPRGVMGPGEIEIVDPSTGLVWAVDPTTGTQRVLGKREKPTEPAGVRAKATADANADADAQRYGFKDRNDPGYKNLARQGAGLPQLGAPGGAPVPQPPAAPGLPADDAPLLGGPPPPQGTVGYPSPAFVDAQAVREGSELGRIGLPPPTPAGPLRARTTPRQSLQHVVPALPLALQARAATALRENPDWTPEDFQRFLAREANLSPEDVKRLRQDRRIGYPSPAFGPTTTTLPTAALAPGQTRSVSVGTRGITSRTTTKGPPIPGRPTQQTTASITVLTEALGAVGRVRELIKTHPHLPGLAQSHILGNRYAQGIEPFSEMDEVKAYASLDAALQSIKLAIYSITGKRPNQGQQAAFERLFPQPWQGPGVLQTHLDQVERDFQAIRDLTVSLGALTPEQQANVMRTQAIAVFGSRYPGLVDLPDTPAGQPSVFRVQ